MSKKNDETNFGKAIAGFADIKKKMAEAIKDATAPARSALAADFRTVFEKHPDILKIRWTQYTPYFNDGEACTFGVNEPYVYTNPDDESDEDYNHAAMEMLPSIDGEDTEEIMLAMFGDHVEVTLKRDATDFEVDEYSHD